MDRTRTRTDLIFAFVLMAVAVAALRAVVGMLQAQGIAFGSDAVLWGLTAMNLKVGAGSFLPPLYPWLIVAALGRMGELVPVALSVSGAIWALLPPAMWLVARRLGASVEAGLLGVILLVTHPELLLFGMQIQPDGLATLILLGAGPVALWFWRSPTALRALGMGAWGTMTWLVREHGAPLLAMYALLAVVAPGSWRLRGGRVALMAALIVLAPMAAQAPPSPPWQAPWMQRIFLATSGSENIPIPPNAPDEILAPVYAHIAAHESGDRVAVMRIHASDNLTRAKETWAFLLLAALALPFVPKRRRILGLPLLTALPTLPILSQPRHVLVLLPSAFLLVASLLDPPDEGERRWPAGVARALLLLPLLALTGYCALKAWGGPGMIYTQKTAETRKEMEFAQELCAYTRTGQLMIGHPGDPRPYLLYCPRPHHTVLPNQRTDADWNTLYVGEQSPGEDWVALGPSLQYRQDSSTVYLFQLAPWLDRPQRPCNGSRPEDRTPYITLSPHIATLEPPCEQTNAGGGF